MHGDNGYHDNEVDKKTAGIKPGNEEIRASYYLREKYDEERPEECNACAPCKCFPPHFAVTAGKRADRPSVSHNSPDKGRRQENNSRHPEVDKYVEPQGDRPFHGCQVTDRAAVYQLPYDAAQRKYGSKLKHPYPSEYDKECEKGAPPLVSRYFAEITDRIGKVEESEITWEAVLIRLLRKWRG